MKTNFFKSASHFKASFLTASIIVVLAMPNLSQANNTAYGTGALSSNTTGVSSLGR